MPLWLIAGGSIFAWEAFAKGDDQSGLQWSAVLKIALIAGAVYLAASAIRRA